MGHVAGSPQPKRLSPNNVHPAFTPPIAPIVVSGALTDSASLSDVVVETTQIAPTILRLLGLSPCELVAVRVEGTKSLPLNH